jgi:hypothetical protein
MRLLSKNDNQLLIYRALNKALIFINYSVAQIKIFFSFDAGIYIDVADSADKNRNKNFLQVAYVKATPTRIINLPSSIFIH